MNPAFSGTAPTNRSSTFGPSSPQPALSRPVTNTLPPTSWAKESFSTDYAAEVARLRRYQPPPVGDQLRRRWHLEEEPAHASTP